jgi:Lrp/AsnC family leucine-responsive transcriptional regulator
MGVNIDRTDLEILRILAKNSKVPYKDISKHVNVSLATVHSRIKKLEAQGFIKGFTVNIN